MLECVGAEARSQQVCIQRHLSEECIQEWGRGTGGCPTMGGLQQGPACHLDTPKMPSLVSTNHSPNPLSRRSSLCVRKTRTSPSLAMIAFWFFWEAVTQWDLAALSVGRGSATCEPSAPAGASEGMPASVSPDSGLPKAGVTATPPPRPLGLRWSGKASQRPGPCGSSGEGRIIKQKSHKCRCILPGVLPACRRSIISGLWTT